MLPYSYIFFVLDDSLTSVLEGLVILKKKEQSANAPVVNGTVKK
jgi:hypothetical protein